MRSRPDTTSFPNSKRRRLNVVIEINTADGFDLLDSKSEDEVNETLITSSSALKNNIDNTDKDLSRAESYRQYNNNNANNNSNSFITAGRDNTDTDVSSTAKIISSGDKQQTSGQEPSPAESPPELVVFDATKKRIEPTEKKVIETDEEVARLLYATSFGDADTTTQMDVEMPTKVRRRTGFLKFGGLISNEDDYDNGTGATGGADTTTVTGATRTSVAPETTENTTATTNEADSTIGTGATGETYIGTVVAIAEKPVPNELMVEYLHETPVQDFLRVCHSEDSSDSHPGEVDGQNQGDGLTPAMRRQIKRAPKFINFTWNKVFKLPGCEPNQVVRISLDTKSYKNFKRRKKIEY